MSNLDLLKSTDLVASWFDVFVYPYDHPNTFWEGVLGMFLGFLTFSGVCVGYIYISQILNGWSIHQQLFYSGVVKNVGKKNTKTTPRWSVGPGFSHFQFERHLPTKSPLLDLFFQMIFYFMSIAIKSQFREWKRKNICSSQKLKLAGPE